MSCTFFWIAYYLFSSRKEIHLVNFAFLFACNLYMYNQSFFAEFIQSYYTYVMDLFGPVALSLKGERIRSESSCWMTPLCPDEFILMSEDCEVTFQV